MTTYVFPGQGSQTIGMGAMLFKEFAEHVQKANTILGYDVAELCLTDPNGVLNQTNYTQPALYVVNALSYLKKLHETDKQPEFLAGHSLGEFNALFAAEVFDFETGLKLVQKRGELMSQVKGGGMAAVIGLKSDQVQSVLQQVNNLGIANYNSYTQIVISGPKDNISTAKPFFVKAGAKLYIPLNVSGAFHSPFMKEAKQQFANFISNFSFSTPTKHVIANVNAKPYKKEEIVDHLADQITHSVMWTQTIEFLLDKGETQFEEIGPGKVLSGLVKRIKQGQ